MKNYSFGSFVSFVFILTLSFVVTSCGVYKKYSSAEANLGVSMEVTDTLPTWREVFTNPQLQSLIEATLKNNPDIQTAQLNIQKAEITYRQSRLNYLPNLSFAPTGTALGNWMKGGSLSTYDYSLGLSASWQWDIFGASLTNTRRLAGASLGYQQDYEQAVECRLITSVAQLYYQLLGLDHHLQIQRDMLQLYQKTYESAQHLFEAGQYTSPAVSETKAQVEAVEVNIMELEYNRKKTVHAICQLMNEAPHDIQTLAKPNLSVKSSEALLANYMKEVPASRLVARPDVRAAERQVEMAYYNMLLAKGELFPKITLTASGGLNGLDPMSWFVKGIGSLVQPIFMNGKLRADLKASRVDQQVALVQFRSTYLSAQHELTDYMDQNQLCLNRMPVLHAEVQDLQDAVDATQELMNNGTATYIEVLNALKELLTAQTAEADNQIDAAKALVGIYGALGGR